MHNINRNQYRSLQQSHLQQPIKSCIIQYKPVAVTCYCCCHHHSCPSPNHFHRHSIARRSSSLTSSTASHISSSSFATHANAVFKRDYSVATRGHMSPIAISPKASYCHCDVILIMTSFAARNPHSHCDVIRTELATLSVTDERMLRTYRHRTVL